MESEHVMERQMKIEMESQMVYGDAVGYGEPQPFVAHQSELFVPELASPGAN